MDSITELADRLGGAIADAPQAKDLRQARDDFNTESELTQVLKDYQKLAEKIAKLETEQKPIEVDDKHKLMELRDKLISSEKFKKLSAAQVEYIDLMRRVNEALQKHLVETEND